MTEIANFEMRNQLRGIGIVHVAEQDRVIDVARKCAKTGMVLGAGWMVLGAPALAPGALAGFLSGFATGTAACITLSYGARETLKKIGTGEIEAP